MNEDQSFRETIAKIISISVIVSTAILGVLAVGLAITYIVSDKSADNKGLDKAQTILQYIFASLLPLWGTWIGTVLAYYFAKENFEAANKQVRELVSQVKSPYEKLNSVPVTEVMMPFEKIKTVKADSPEGADKLIVDTVRKQLETDGTRRALIFHGRKIIYVLHKSLLADFLYRSGDQSKTKTIANMKEDQDKDTRLAFLNGVGIISKDATLLDVKNLMDNLPGCQDVFVTDNGKRDGDVLGWVSNVDVFEKSKA